MSTFAIMLKELMEEKSIDAKSLAKHIELSSVSIIYEWLKSEKSLLLSNAVKIADFFTCSLDYLFGRSQDFGNGIYKTCPPFDVQLRKVLKEQKVSQAKLMRNNIISSGNIYCWFNEKGMPHIRSIMKIANYLNISMDHLVGREKENNNN